MVRSKPLHFYGFAIQIMLKKRQSSFLHKNRTFPEIEKNLGKK
jgi:hypothetical protein